MYYIAAIVHVDNIALDYIDLDIVNDCRVKRIVVDVMEWNTSVLRISGLSKNLICYKSVCT